MAARKFLFKKTTLYTLRLLPTCNTNITDLWSFYATVEYEILSTKA